MASNQPVEKPSITACGSRFGFKNACFEPLKPDLEPPEPVYAAMNVPGSSFFNRLRAFSEIREILRQPGILLPIATLLSVGRDFSLLFLVLPLLGLIVFVQRLLFRRGRGGLWIYRYAGRTSSLAGLL